MQWKLTKPQKQHAATRTPNPRDDSDGRVHTTTRTPNPRNDSDGRVHATTCTPIESEVSDGQAMEKMKQEMEP